MARDTRLHPRLSRRRWLTLAACAAGAPLLAPLARAAPRPTPPPRFNRQSPDQDKLTIVTLTGDYPFLVDILFNRQTTDSALLAQPPLQPDEAVLYAVDVVRPIALSNRGVPFATDILFISQEGRIVSVNATVMANSPTVFVSMIPVKAALQTLGGTVRRLAIRPGDHVLHPMFGRTL